MKNILKSISLTLGLVLVFGIVQPPQKQEVTYFSHGNFGGRSFAAAYPVDFIMDPPPTNNDGRSFTSPDGQATISCWSSFNVLFETPETGMQNSIEWVEKEGGKVTYKAQKDNWFVISGFTKDDKIFYKKNIVNENIVFGMMFTYPKSQAAKYNRLCGPLAGALKPLE